ncbi:hypothetical protein [Paenarthrobacter sp. NPDC091669]|uniref:hypothetical protein n=1 Tax=Paenarthrobacter sp. NPDC091669 TaxID=3364384 RepID=UPI00381455FC
MGSTQEDTGAGGDHVDAGYDHSLRSRDDFKRQFGEQHNGNTFSDTIANTQQGRWDGLQK